MTDLLYQARKTTNAAKGYQRLHKAAIHQWVNAYFLASFFLKSFWKKPSFFSLGSVAALACAAVLSASFEAVLPAATAVLLT